MKKSIWVLLLTLTRVWALLPDEQNNVDIYQKCHPSVVNITATSLARDFFFDIVPQKGQGSGFLVRPDGYVATNHHVIGNAVNVEVTLSDKSTFPAKVIGVDPDSDLAILKIDPKGKKLSTVEFATAEGMKVGQKVLAIGNPFGLGGSLSTGVISSLERDIRAASDRLIKGMIQIDAAINPGNSGGPLLDSSGKLIGINTQILSPSGASHGVGFAISVKTAKRIIDQLIQYGKVLRPALGLEGVGLGNDLLSFLGYNIAHGVMVLSLERGSSASVAGLKPANGERRVGFRLIPVGGDIIFQIDEAPVGTMRDILDYLFDKKPGETVTLHYLRGKAKKTVAVTLKVPAVGPVESI